MAISLTKPTVGGSESTWGLTINTGLDTIADALNGTAGTVAPNLSTLTIGGTDVTATAAELNTASSHYVPSGGIIMWSGAVSAIPAGWVLCNGSNSTPDLRDRFVVGAGSSYAVNATGGASTVALSTANLPAHNHTASSTSTSTVTDPGHTHTQNMGSPNVPTGGSTAWSALSSGVSNNGYQTDSKTTGISVSTSTTTTTSNTGSGTAHENKPPYYALAYIMKT
jgi:microcystin-dependent protein